MMATAPTSPYVALAIVVASALGDVVTALAVLACVVAVMVAPACVIALVLHALEVG